MSILYDEIAYPRFIQKRHKYYVASDVNNHLLRVATEVDSERAERFELETRLHELLAANQKQAYTIATFRDKGIAQEQQIDEQIGEISMLGDQLTTYYNHNAACLRQISEQEKLLTEQSNELSVLGDQLTEYRNNCTSHTEFIAQQNVQIVSLKKQLSTLSEQVALQESQHTDEVVQQAMQKADQVAKKATADSERIMRQVSEQRDRLIAACRAAYYSALQFKQDLADQFRTMEYELDASIDVLQLMDNSRLVLNRTADASYIAEQGEGQGAILQ